MEVREMGNCDPPSISSFVINLPMAELMAVFAGIGWAVSSIIYYLPVSSSTRATAATVRDHALFAAILAGMGSAIASLVDFILSQAAGYAGGQLPAATIFLFNALSAVAASVIMGFFSAVMAAGPAIPVLGAFLSFIVAVVYFPVAAIIGTILIFSATNSVGYFILLNSMPVLFPVGMVLYAVPGRYAKGIGAYLISLAVVSHVALPILPIIVAQMMNAVGAGIDAAGLARWISSTICGKATNVSIDTFLSLLNPMNWFLAIVQWFVGVMVSAFLLVMVHAAARALSHSLGGVSANL
jgi:hypothetical protein